MQKSWIIRFCKCDLKNVVTYTSTMAKWNNRLLTQLVKSYNNFFLNYKKRNKKSKKQSNNKTNKPTIYVYIYEKWRSVVNKFKVNI